LIQEQSRLKSLTSFIVPAIFYSVIAFLLGYSFWPYFYYVKNETLFVIGFVGIWRYGLLLINYIRAFIYRYIVYKLMKYKTFSKPLEKQFPQHIYFCIPSYKEEQWVSTETFESIFNELSTIPSSATIVVSIANQKDENAIRDVYHAHPYARNVELIIQYQHEGKRIAMGHALRVIARDVNDKLNDDSITILMDGDSYLTKDSLRKSIPILYTQNQVGAVTTDEVAYIDSKSNWYKDWFNLKFGQRHILFQSQSLSKKVLTLTGRFSLFKTDIIISEEFISHLENDILTDGNFGKFRFLMGDDKTTWFYLLKHNYEMLYLPDVTIYSLESRDGDFLKISKSLPYRWYGNTLRNNYRARALDNIPIFIRYLLWDQLFLMWTALIGIIGVILLTIFINPVYLPIYIAWILCVRVFQMLVIVLGNHSVSLRTVPLMLYNQWIGALIKINAFYHLYDQQYSKGKNNSQNADKMIKFTYVKFVPFFSNYRMYFGTIFFLFSMVMLNGKILEFPTLNIFIPSSKHLNTYYCNAMKVERLNQIIKNAQDGTTIFLPKGELHIYQPILITRSNITINGKGTTIISHLKSDSNAVIMITGKKGAMESFTQTKSKLWNVPFLDVEKAGAIQNGTMLLIEQDNDKDFIYNILGSTHWYEKYPRLRSEIVKVLDKKGDFLYLQYNVKSKMGKGSKVYKLKMIHNINLKNITIDNSKKVTNQKYINSDKDSFVDGIKFYYVYDSNIKNIKIYNSGSNPLVFERCYHIIGNNIKIDKAQNKGKGGNGYLRFNKSFHIHLENVEVKKIRHIAFQWASAYNSIKHLYTEVDINFHGGATHDNEIVDVKFNISTFHRWGKIYRTPKNASWAPPDLENNRVQERKGK